MTAWISEADLANKIESPVNELSEGQKQRLALLRAKFFQSKILLLDEATSALDPVNQQRLLSLLLDGYSGIVISVTHDVSPIDLALFTHQITLENGRITGSTTI